MAAHLLCFDNHASDLEHTLNRIDGNHVWPSSTQCASLYMLSINTSDLKHNGLQKWQSLAQPHAMLVVAWTAHEIGAN
jgi:hypothetical protein